MLSSKVFLIALLWLLFIIYVLVPLLLYLFPQLLRKMVFANAYYCPHYSRNFSDFDQYGLDPAASRNFQLRNSRGLALGAWQLEPEPTAADQFLRKLSDGRPVLLYFHGNALNRAGHHMLALYRRLLQLNLHLLAVDYRGYGDSEGSPQTEADVVDDAESLFKFATETAGAKSVYFWGHSLGTGVASHLAKRVSDSGGISAVRGIVLESPFTNIRDGVRLHHFSFPYRWLPYFETVFVDGVTQCGIFFESDKNLASVNVPTLIVHAEDDVVVPLALGRRLHSQLAASGRPVQLLQLPASEGCRHVHAWRAPQLYQAVRRLLQMETV